MLIFSLDAQWIYSKMVSGSLIRNNIYFKNKMSIKIKLISVDTEKKKLLKSVIVVTVACR